MAAMHATDSSPAFLSKICPRTGLAGPLAQLQLALKLPKLPTFGFALPKFKPPSLPSLPTIPIPACPLDVIAD